MGRRDRLRREAIIGHQQPSIRQMGDELAFHAVRLATRELFTNPKYGSGTFQTWSEDIAEALVAVLPQACTVVGRNTFAVRDITRRKDWLEMTQRMLLGVLAHYTDKFRKMDTKGDIWYIRKRKRVQKGYWRLCFWCGQPFYTSPSRVRALYDSRSCFALAKKAGKHPTEGSAYEEALLDGLTLVGR
jgi:hypothetical protein